MDPILGKVHVLVDLLYPVATLVILLFYKKNPNNCAAFLLRGGISDVM